MTDSPALVPVVIAGREIKVLPPEFSKLSLLMHQARILKRDVVSKEEAIRALDVTGRIVWSAFPDKDDREFLEDLIADGMITLPELIKDLMSSIKDQETDEPKAPVVRRGRPRKKV